MTSLEEIGAHVRDGAHEQAAGAAALDDEFVLLGVVERDEVFGALR